MEKQEKYSNNSGEQKYNISKEEMKASIPRIIACDFDGTLVTDEFPKIGKRILSTWDALEQEIMMGTKIILWTCRDGENLAEAIRFCGAHGLIFDAVNENIKETKELFNNDTRKVFADEYWDDKANKQFSKVNTYYE
jgi:hypothetical protein